MSSAHVAITFYHALSYQEGDSLGSTMPFPKFDLSGKAMQVREIVLPFFKSDSFFNPKMNYPLAKAGHGFGHAYPVNCLYSCVTYVSCDALNESR